MGNADLVITINGESFLIEGKDYDTEKNAIATAIDKYLSRIHNEYMQVKEASQDELLKDKEEFLDEIQSKTGIKTIEVRDVII